MVSFNKFFTSVSLAIVYASVSNAAPSPISAKFSTHRVRTIGNVKVEAYHPKASYEVSKHLMLVWTHRSGSVTYKGGYSRAENRLTLSRYMYEFRHIGFPDLMLSSPERHLLRQRRRQRCVERKQGRFLRFFLHQAMCVSVCSP